MSYISFKKGYFRFGNSHKQFHIWLIIILLMIVYFTFSTIFVLNRFKILQNYGTTINAVIINETGFVRNSHITKEVVYKYEFFANGRLFKGDSQCKRFNVGDSLLIRYWTFRPSVNQPLWILNHETCNLTK